MTPAAVLAATIGSITALLIAFVAYPWQKARDRHLTILTEKRAAYGQFIRKFNQLEKWMWAWEVPPKPLPDILRDELSILYLYAPANVIDACQKAYEDRIEVIAWNWKDADSQMSKHGRDYSEEISAALLSEQRMVQLMREDLWGTKTSPREYKNLRAAGVFGDMK